MTATRVTQEALEALDAPTPASRVSQEALESVTAATPTDRVTQVALEAVVSQAVRVRHTQVALEVVVPYATPLATASASRQLWPRGGDLVSGDANAPSGPATGDLSGTYPAPTVAGLKGLPMVGTLGANQVWAKDPSNNQLIPASTGTPTVQYTRWDPFVPDASPHALNEEFTGTSLANFTSIYIAGESGVTVDANTTMPGWVWFELAVPQNYRFRSLMKALPGDTNWTIHTAMMSAHKGTDGFWGGLGLANGVTPNAGQQMTIGTQAHSDVYRRSRVQWDGYGNTVTGASGSTFGAAAPLTFLRWRKQAGTLYMGWSTDPQGQLWYEESTTQYVATQTHFGLMIDNYTGAGVRAAFAYLRYYPIGTQLTTGASVSVYG
jgi:hypothetical protein